MSRRAETWWLTVLFVLTAIVFRLPQLSSGNVALDGDEAVLGLMALDLLEGRGAPIFFYGQQYGLALFEVLPLAATFQTFGATPLVAKATMLGLWILGGAFTVRAAYRIGGGLAGTLVGLLLATMPTWIPWSMKARGGYVTAFAASQFALWVLAGFLRRKLESTRTAPVPGAVRAGGSTELVLEPPSRSTPGGGWREPVGGFVLGVAVVITLLAQPLFLVPVLPFFVFLRPLSAWLGLFTGALAFALPLLSHAGALQVSWAPRIFGMFDPGGLGLLPFRVTTAIGGYYWYLVPGEPPEMVVWAGRVFAAVGFLGVVYALVSRARDQWTDAIWASAVGIVTFFLLTLFILPDQFAYRYLLPLGAATATLLGLVSARLLEGSWGRGMIYVASAFLFGIAAASTWAGRGASLAVAPGDERGSETLATNVLVAHLEERGIENAYVLDPMYQWNLIFASGRKVHARWEDPVDRVPEISRAVDAAYAAGEPVALIGDARFAPRLKEALDGSGWTHLRIDVLENRHFVLEAPPRTLLEALEFRFLE